MSILSRLVKLEKLFAKRASQCRPGTDGQCCRKDVREAYIDIFNGLNVPIEICDECHTEWIQGDDRRFAVGDAEGICERASEIFRRDQREIRRQHGLKY